MLKHLTPSTFFDASPSKCGEIFHHNFNDFTIFCTICQMKSFNFDDFLQHVRNVHLENHPQHATSTDTNELEDFLEEDLENEGELCNIEISFDNCMEQDISEVNVESCSEEENLLILKRPRKNDRERCNSESYDVDNESSAKELEFESKSSHHRNEKLKSEKSNKPQQYSCPECQQIFDLKKYMDNHVIEVHKGYKCSICDSRFLYRNHLQRHEQKHNPDFKFPCPIAECTRIFNDPDNLQRHLLKHNPEENFPCPIPECDHIYRNSRNLERHLNIHKNINRHFNRFVCDMCGYSCRAEGTLIIHRRSHTGERPFLCEICKKGFVSKGALNIHMEKHLNIRRFACEICNASFSRSEILVKHMFIHSDEKRFKCKVCDKAFKQPQGLYCHMRRLHMEPKVTEKDKEQ